MSVMNRAPWGAQTPAKDRRLFPRYQLPLSNQLEVHWNGDLLPLEPDFLHENVSAGGVCVCVGSEAPPPPVGAELDVVFRAAEGPLEIARRFLRAQARVVRREAPNRIAVRFERVSRVRLPARDNGAGDRI